MTKPETKSKFASSMLRFVSAIKEESAACSEVCGDINEKELMIIVFVGENKDVKMSDIAENINAPLSTLTSIVDKLVERHFLTRFHSDEDRRVVNVSLAVKGKNAFKTFLQRKDEMAEKVLSKFSGDEQVSLIASLDRISSAIEAMK